MVEIEEDLYDEEFDIRLASEAVVEERMNICRRCIRFMKKTEQCELCLCIMPYKTRTAEAECPIHKWGPV
jgi:hypothetical protein